MDLQFLPNLEEQIEESGYQTRGRNSRKPKKSNHGARPCSSVMRNLKKKGWYNKVKDE